MTATARLLAADDELDGDDAFDREMTSADWSKLCAVIDASDAAYARGETVPVEVLFEDLRRIRAER